MKNKQKILLPVAVIIIAAVIIPAVWYFLPKTFLRGVEPSEVKSIPVFDGCSGNSFAVEDTAEIKYIVENIQSVRMRKDNISAAKKGWNFRMKFYDGDGKELDSFFVESSSRIRKDPFYYCGSCILCFDYLTELEDKYSQ